MKLIIHRKPTFRILNSTLALSPSNVLPIILSLFFLSQTSINKAPIQNSKLNIQNSLELVIQNGHTAAVNGIQLTKDEKKLISYSADNTIKIWDISEENMGEEKLLLKTLEVNTESVIRIKLTKDESNLILYSDSKIIEILDLNERKFLNSKDSEWTRISMEEKSLFPVHKMKPDIKDEKVLRALNGYNASEENGNILTKDKKRLISFYKDGCINIWDMEKMKLLKTLNANTSKINGIQITKDKINLIFYSKDIIKHWDVDNKKYRTIKGKNIFIDGMQVTNDAKKLISYSTDGFKVWDIENEKLAMTFGFNDYKRIGRIQFINNEKKLLSFYEDGTNIMWDLESGQPLTTLKEFTDRVNGIQFTKDEKKIISYFDANIKIWDIEKGTLLGEMKGPSYSMFTASVAGVKITNDERKLISYSQGHPRNNRIYIWDLENKKLLKTLNGHNSSVAGIQLTKDERKLISFSYYSKDNKEQRFGNDSDSLEDNTVRIWDLDDGKLIHTLIGHTDTIYDFKMTNDEKTLISFSKDNTIMIWDMDNGKLKHTLNHYSIKQIILKENQSNKTLLLSISYDGSLRYWDMDTGKLLLTQLLFKEGESIYYTADGYFDFTDKKVMDYIAYTSPSIQSGFIDLQDLWEDYKRDDLKEAVLAGRFKPKKGSNLIRSVETTPVIKTLFDPQKTISPDKDNYPMRIQVSEKGSRLGSVVVFVNGVQVVNTKLSEESTEKDMEIKEEESSGGKSFQLKFPVPLNYGTNRVEIKAYNEFGIPQSFPAFDLERKTPANLVLPKPNLFVLSVGVNEYQKNKLKFSVKDAEAMADVLSKNGKELYSAIHVKKLLDKDATKKGIEDALADIARNAKPEDVVLIYLSGHGNNASSREVKSLFYFVPFDFNWSSDSQAEYVAREQGIDAEYLNETFTKIKSHKVILILDACHSGSIQTAMLAKGEDETKASRKAMDRMANGTGRFIFASSAGNELSREHSEAGHGLYTYVLLNALGKNTDKKIPNADYINADGFIYLSEIRSYIEQKFEDQTEKYLTGVRQSPPSMSLGRTGMHERVNDFPLLKVK